ncbi:MAG TPA: transglutaminase family protein [Myxococcales bacterium]
MNPTCLPLTLLFLLAEPDAGSAASVPAPISNDTYVMTLAGTPVGTVRLTLTGRAGGGFEFEYESQTFVKRVTAVVRNHAQARLQLSDKKVVEHVAAESREGAALVRTVSGATREGVLRLTVAKGRSLLPGEAKQALPVSLAFAELGNVQKCVPALDETSGEVGTVCGMRAGDEAKGTLLGQPFVARLSGRRLEKLELPEQHAAFLRTDKPPTSFDPPDLMAGGIVGDGLRGLEESDAVRITIKAGKPLDLPASGNQAVSRLADGVVVGWTRVPILDEAPWKAARDIAEIVYDSIPDKRPGPNERLPRRVLREGRGACVAHTESFLALAKARKLASRRALGLVAADGFFWPHEWVQVQIRGAWYDVDPTEGAAPALSARVLFAAGEKADEKVAARLVELVRTGKVAVEAR